MNTLLGWLLTRGCTGNKKQHGRSDKRVVGLRRCLHQIDERMVLYNLHVARRGCEQCQLVPVGVCHLHSQFSMIKPTSVCRKLHGELAFCDFFWEEGSSHTTHIS